MHPSLRAPVHPFIHRSDPSIRSVRSSVRHYLSIHSSQSINHPPLLPSIPPSVPLSTVRALPVRRTSSWRTWAGRTSSRRRSTCSSATATRTAARRSSSCCRRAPTPWPGCSSSPATKASAATRSRPSPSARARYGATPGPGSSKPD